MSKIPTRRNTLGMRILRFVIHALAKALNVSIVDLLGERSPELVTGFGRNVRRLRKAYGWTVEVLAERARLSPYQLYEIEIGTAEPSLMTIKVLAKTLGVSMGELLGERRPELVMVFGRNVRRVRKASSWTVEELAERAGVVAEAFGVSMDGLLSDRPLNPAAVFGRNVRRVRKALGWTVEELAKRIEKSPTWVNFIEMGIDTPSLTAIYAVAKALGVPVMELFGDRPPDRDPPSPGAQGCRTPAEFAVSFHPLESRHQIAPWHPMESPRERKPAAMVSAK
ncbi:MAG: helix-turn-helix transcriptional regulator [Polyangiaceae bacterium]|nr:helix-turn-helix transcriptional regulator [Polyangiaceae bacterium]